MIEQRIGKKIKVLRKYFGLSQIELAEKIGISFQQIQKYEKGSSKISVSRLHQISEALGIPITAFFEEDAVPRLSDVSEEYGSTKRAPSTIDALSTEEINLLKLFRMTKNKRIREGILKQLQGVAELEHGK